MVDIILFRDAQYNFDLDAKQQPFKNTEFPSLLPTQTCPYSHCFLMLVFDDNSICYVQTAVMSQLFGMRSKVFLASCSRCQHLMPLVKKH